MAKPFKIVLFVFGTLLLLLIAAAIALPLLFDPNHFRGQIAQAVEKETGRSFEVGDIQLRVFPWLRVAVADVTLGNAEGFGADPFAQVRQVGVGVKLMPLLTDRQVEVSSVTLDGLRLNLAVDAQGKSNWQDLIDRQEQKPETPEEPAAEGGVKFELVDIGGVTISDAIVRYSDAQAGQAYRLEPFNLKTGTLTPGKPFDIETDLTAYADQPKVQAAVTLSTTVTPDMDARIVVLDAVKASVKAQGEKLVSGQNASADLTLSGKGRMELDKQWIELEGLKATLKAKAEKLLDGQDAEAELNFAGDARVDLQQQRVETGALDLGFNAKAADLAADGTLKLKLLADLAAQTFAADGLTLDAKASGKAVPGQMQTVTLAGKARFDQKNDTLSFDDGRIEALGLNISAQIRGTGVTGDKPRLSGPISIAQFSPRDTLKRLGIELETTDPKALATATVKARYAGGLDSATLDELAVTLDQTQLQGNLAITNFATQALQFALKVDTIDADRYLPPKAEEAKPTATAANKQDVNAIELPTEMLEQLNANGTLDIGKLKINGLQLTDVRLKLGGSGKAPKTQELSAKLYGGNVNLSNRYSDAGSPAFAIKTQLDALQAAPFLKDLLGKDYVSGLGNVNLDLTTRGKTVGDLRKTLNGTISVKAQNGAVKGFNLGEILRKGEAMLAGQAAPSESGPLETDFATISASATITNGVLKTSDLAAASPLFRLAGSGELDLANETIRFLAKPTVVETSKGQGGKALEQLKGLTIPIEISGNLFSPKYKLALEDVAKEKARAVVKDKIAEELGLPAGQNTEQDIKQKLNEKLGDLLSGRRKRDEATPAPTATPAPATAPAATPAPTENPAPEAPTQ